MRKSSVPVRALLFALIVFILSIMSGAVLAQDAPPTQPPEPDFVEPQIPSFDIQPQNEPEAVEPELPDPIVIQPLDPATAGDHAVYPVIVRLKNNFVLETSLNDIAAVQSQRYEIQMAQENVLEQLSSLDTSVSNVHQYETIPYVALHVDAAGLAALQNNPNVEAIFQDEVRELATYHSNQKVGAMEAWNLGFEGDGYAVAVIDTGVDTDSPAFSQSGKVVGEACFGTNDPANSFVPACPGGVDELIGPGAAEPVDPSGCTTCYHGTHVAGIAVGNGGANPSPLTGTFRGVAPGANLIAVNVFSIKTTQKRPGAFDSDVIAGLEYVYRLATDGPDGNPSTPDALKIASVNMSLGGGQSFTDCDGGSDPGYFAVVQQLANQNIATIAASGNNGFKNAVGFPSCYSNIIAVGATTVEASDPNGLQGDDNTVGYFSNSAEMVALLAPGFWVTSVVPSGTGPGGVDYRTLNGTSMASPYVAGTWAIMRQRFPNASVDDLLEHISITGIPITDNGQSTAYGSSNGNGITRPLIQVRDAIYLAEPELIDPLSIAFDLQPIFRWKDMVLTDSYEIRLYDAVTDELVRVRSNFTSCNNGECAIASGVSLQNDHDYYWTVQGMNASGVTSPIARADFTIKANSPSGNIITNYPDFVFQRDTSTNISQYELKIEALTPQGSLEQVIHQQWYPVPEVCDVTACIINPGIDLGIYAGDRKMQWSYRPFNASTNTEGAWMGPYQFTILAPDTPGPVSPFTNIRGRASFLVEELTDGIRTADWYRFLVYDPETGAIPGDVWLPITAAENCNNDVCLFTLPFTLYNDDHLALYVSAYTETLNGYSTWSTGLDFAVNAPPPSVSSLELVGIYDDVQPLTGTGFVGIDCPLSGGEPTCGVMRPYFEIEYDVNGTFSGDWIEIVVYNWDEGTVPVDEWVNLRGDYPNENAVCGLKPITPPIQTCLVQVPETTFLGTGNYTWFVRSYGAGGFSTGGISGFTNPGGAAGGDPNNIANFNVSLPGQTVTGAVTALTATPAALVGTTQTSGIEGEVTFMWDHEPSALWYNLIVRDSSADADVMPVWDGWYEVGENVFCDANCTLVTDHEFLNGTYNWTVRYWNGSISPTSTPESFTLQLPAPVMPALSTLSVYLDETVSGNTSPRYEWQRVDNATWYSLYVQTSDGEQVHYQDYRALNICDETLCRAMPDHHLLGDNYEWYLTARGPGGNASGGIQNTGWIGPAMFTMSGTPTGSVLPLTPSSVTLTHNVPSFAWRPATNASWYRLEVINQITNDTVIDTWIFAPDYSCTTIVQNAPACVVEPGIGIANSSNYVWYVTPFGAGGLGNRSLGAFFGVNAPLSSVVTLIVPEEDSLQPNDVRFEWSDGNADYYGLEIRDKNGTVVYVEWFPAEMLACSGGKCGVTLAKEAVPAGILTWTVSTWLPSNGLTVRPSAPSTFTKL